MPDSTTDSTVQPPSSERPGEHAARRSRRRHRPSDPQRLARTRRLHLGVLLFVTLWAYVTALSGGFVWYDDRNLIEGGQRLLSPGDPVRALTLSNDQYRKRLDGGVPPVGDGNWQPTAILNYTLSWTLFGECSLCHHLENLLWHALTVIGLYALGRHLLNLRRHGTTLAFWAALAFAVHPVGVSSVAWIGARPVVLASALSIWCLVLFTRLPATSKSHRHHINRWQLGIGLTLVFALGAEGRTYMLPLAALLIAWFETRERGRRGLDGISRQRRLALLGIAAMVLAVVVYRTYSVGLPGQAGGYPGPDPLTNMGTAARLFWAQLAAIVVPGEPVVSDAFPVTTQWEVRDVAAVLGMVAVIAATLFGVRLRHPLGLGMLWYLIWSLPASGLLPQQRYYDETALYPAYWGVVFGLTYVLFRLWRPLGRQMVRGSEAVVFGPLALLLLVLTASSNIRWQSSTTLFESEINNDPHYREGRVVLAGEALRRGRPEAALQHALVVEESRRDQAFTGFVPEYLHHMQLGRAQLSLGLFQDARLSFAQAVALNPLSVRALQGLAEANLAVGEPAQAEANIRSAQRIWPQDAGLSLTLGRIRLHQGQIDEARELFHQAMARGLRGAEVRLALARTHALEGRYQHAEEELRRIAPAERGRPQVRAQRAWVLWKLGRDAEARKELRGIDSELPPGSLTVAQWRELRAGLGVQATAPDSTIPD